jgi:hypothetical protein
VVSRLVLTDHRPEPIGLLTRGRVHEEDMPEIIYSVEHQAEDLHRLLLGE